MIVQDIENQKNNFQIGDIVLWNSTTYGQIIGTVISEPIYTNGLYIYYIHQFNNNINEEYEISWVPHQMYRLTSKLE